MKASKTVDGYKKQTPVGRIVPFDLMEGYAQGEAYGSGWKKKQDMVFRQEGRAWKINDI